MTVRHKGDAMENISALIALLLIGTFTVAQITDSGPPPAGDRRCYDEAGVRHIPGGGTAFTDDALFQRLPNGSVRIRDPVFQPCRRP